MARVAQHLLREITGLDLSCPECGEPITFTLVRVASEFGGPDRWGVTEIERWCGCQLDDFPDKGKGEQPIDALIAQAIRTQRTNLG